MRAVTAPKYLRKNEPDMTERLYRNDVYMTECEAVITNIETKDGRVILEFDRSVFFPEGGGQSCDLGFIANYGQGQSSAGKKKDAPVFNVTDVQENGERVLHTIETGDPGVFRTGDAVTMKIDWDRRFDNMQRHCGEHILSGIFYREFGGVNRGFHMGDDYMTIDISLEEKPEFKEVTWDMAKHAELCANEVIWSNAPVTVHYFATKKDAETFPMRKKLEIEENISIVCVGDPSDPSDSVACCGTHPAYAGQIGLIKIWKVEPNKGMFRIYCEAGKRAYLDYQKKHDLVTVIGNKYSAGPDDLLDKMAAHDEKSKAMRQELGQMRRMVAEARIKDIELGLRELDPKAKMIVRIYDDLRPDDLMNIGKAFIGNTDKLVALATLTENVVMLFSDGKSFDCGRLIKENAPIYNGKGGGRNDNARALFPSQEYLETFLDLLEKHIR